MKLGLYFPLKPFNVTQGFGENLSTVYKSWGLKGHPGIDMVGTIGQTIRAVAEGEVTYVGYDSNEGLGIVIRTQQQYDYMILPFGSTETEVGGVTEFKHIYWHLLDGSARVKVGDIIRTGDVLGQCDSTGVLLGVKFGPASLSHLHFSIKPVLQGEDEWRWDNVLQDNGYNGAVDPDPYWNGLYAVDVAYDSPIPPIEPPPPVEDPVVVENLKKQVTLLQMVVELYKKLIALFK